MTNRTIKFRVYDSISKQYYYWNTIKDIPLSLFNLDHYTLEQYIGLTDSQDVEIYEGDIINGLSFNGSYHHGVVEYYGNSFIAVPVGKYSEGTSDKFSQGTIIGNIHEYENA